MAKAKEVTTKYRVDISEFKAGIQEANRDIKLANAQFKAASAGMDDWSSSADGLTAKINSMTSVLDAEKRKLANLEGQYEATHKAEENAAKAKTVLAKKIEDRSEERR